MKHKSELARYEHNIEGLKITDGLSYYEHNVVVLDPKVYGLSKASIGTQGLISLSIQLIKQQLEHSDLPTTDEDIKNELISWVDYLMKKPY